MQEVKVSVLVAIYNAEKYLPHCLDSLSNQTLRECQFVCIDDCSTDSSADIVRRYAAIDSRFQLIRTPVNSGQAVARNLGLTFARGQYVTMLDADDWFAPDSLQLAYDKIQATPDCDCSVFRLIMVEKDVQTLYHGVSKGVFSGQQAFRLSLDWQLHGYYLISRQIHLRYPYDTSCRLYSDDNTTRLHYLHSKVVAFSDGIYYYRQHEESMTHRFTPMRFLFMDAFSSLKQQIQTEIQAGNIDDAEAVMTRLENLRWSNYVNLTRYFIRYENKMSAQERADIMNRLISKLQSFETDRIASDIKWRPGYMPIKHWQTFYWQQNLFLKIYPLYKTIKLPFFFLTKSSAGR